MDKRSKRTFIADNAPLVKSVPVESGDEGWGLRLVLYPNPDLNNVVADNGAGGHFSINGGSIFHHSPHGELEYAMVGGNDWDRITSQIPAEVYNTAREWLDELDTFARERKVQL